MKRIPRGFTLIELLTVMVIIAILAGLVLSLAGYAQRKAATARAEGEIAAMSAQLESYKADNGAYPRGNHTDELDPKQNGDPSTYKSSSGFLYKALTGDDDRNPTNARGLTASKTYMELKPGMLAAGSEATNTYLVDPFGNSYGYSTANSQDSSRGYNPTFDLWSTAGKRANPSETDKQWIKNW